MADLSGFAINTYSYTLTTSGAACLERLAGQGADTFELMMYPGHAWPEDMDPATRRAFRDKVAGLGARIVSLNMPNIDINIAAADVDMRTYSLHRMTGVIGLAGDLGVPGVVISPGKPNPLLPMGAETLRGHFFAGLDVMLPLAEKAGTQLWLENMPFASLPRAAQMMDALAAYGSDDIGVVYDIANAVFAREDVGEGLVTVAPRLKLMHLSDTRLDAYQHAPVGTGDVDFAAAAKAAKAAGYRGPAMLEIIDANPDVGIGESAEKLRGMGWPVAPSP